MQVGMRAVVEPELEKRSAQELRGHTGAIRGLAVTPDGKYLASASEDGSVIIWNPVTGRQIEVLRDELGGEATAIACGPMTATGQSERERRYSFVAGYNDGNARLWRIQIGADGTISKEKPI